MEEIRSLFTIVAVLISFWSAYTVKRLWYQANRPILSAALKENCSGTDTVLFDLVVYNSGNRPATNIYFSAKQEDVERIFTNDADIEFKKELHVLLAKQAKIQLLLNNSEVSTAFSGCSISLSNTACGLKYESELPIIISYSDIDGNKYSSEITLYVRDSAGFGGSIWR